ncbi:hypothetical protein HK414_12945 [Ramlibacter terrae]|uniref:Uncharacterized protein n=1 Tax=Ramlibacter terrae TaxID=2732511 RepID=A0ABX6P3R3_9BURK|nr:hypothetical protein HK414_12945 [Ramlibacter terrae]
MMAYGHCFKHNAALGVDVFTLRNGATEYRGTIAAMVAAGIITADQVPESSSVTFYKGERIGRGCARGRMDEHYLQVKRVGTGRVYVTKGNGSEVEPEASSEGDKAEGGKSDAAALPSLDWGFAQAFAAHWHLLPTHAKILHAMAASRGLLVMHSDHESLPRRGRRCGAGCGSARKTPSGAAACSKAP